MHTHSHAHTHTDIILLCVWIFLLVTGITVQITFWAIAKKKFERKERELGRFSMATYNSFPCSPYEQLKEYFERRREGVVGMRNEVVRRTDEPGEWEPLLSPNNITRQRLI